MKKILFALCFLGSLSLVHAADKVASEPMETSTRMVRYYVTYQINPDATHTETVERAIKVLKASALESVKEDSFSYSTSVEKIDIIEAYTQKPDGTKIPVPADNYQRHQADGKDKGKPIYSDRSSLSLVYPSVEVNDTVVVIYKRTQTEAIFPNRFS